MPIFPTNFHHFLPSSMPISSLCFGHTHSFYSAFCFRVPLPPEFRKSCPPCLCREIILSFQVPAQSHFLQKVFSDLSYPGQSFLPCIPIYVPLFLCYRHSRDYKRCQPEERVLEAPCERIVYQGRTGRSGTVADGNSKARHRYMSLA